MAEGDIEVQNQHIEMSKALDYASVIQVRLDTSPVIERIQRFLTGKYVVVTTDEFGKPSYKEEKIHEPKANEEGIHWILNYVSAIVNPSVVQGNFVSDSDLKQYLFNVHGSLNLNLMRNLYKWEIKEQDYEPIIDMIMDLVEPYMTRLLGNKERDSYGGMRVIENTSMEQRSKGFHLNPFRKGD